jgi:hypothetical protein
MKLQIDNLVYKYKEDCNDASSLYTNTELTKNLVNDLTSLFSLNGVVVPKGTCCLKPKKIGKVNDMFESWDECENCGKEIV